ncbi:hypothetical protein ACLKA7_001126 [Drosophila subpalustris]
MIRANSDRFGKTPAMRLQSLLYKDKHFKIKSENSSLNVPFKGKSRIEEFSLRDAPAANHQKVSAVDPKRNETPTFVEESSSPRLISKSGIFVRKRKDPSTSTNFNRSDINPKLR